eukprot:GHVU01230356.1.p1 GENE.GHVU01230356.1~~GHVU01230356.1.p1  ORF type:complete len:115 (+),score=3.27 GHVU01230356.1:200-544(+)
MHVCVLSSVGCIVRGLMCSCACVRTRLAERIDGHAVIRCVGGRVASIEGWRAATELTGSHQASWLPPSWLAATEPVGFDPPRSDDAHRLDGLMMRVVVSSLMNTVGFLYFFLQV